MTKSQKQRVLDLNQQMDYPWDEAGLLALAESVLKAVSNPKHRIFARVHSVSKSGMSRTISLAVIHKGDIINLNFTPFRSVYADSKQVERYGGGVRINGCGMDMLWEATYRLYCFFYPYTSKGQKKRYQEHLNRYTSY